MSAAPCAESVHMGPRLYEDCGKPSGFEVSPERGAPYRACRQHAVEALVFTRAEVLRDDGETVRINDDGELVAA